MSSRKPFAKPNWGPPPQGYIAGLGRGATGFTTRADISGAPKTVLNGD